MKHIERIPRGAGALTLGLVPVPNAHAAVSFHVAIRRPSAVRPFVVRTPARPVFVRTSAPVAQRWYASAPRIVVSGAPYYLHGGLGVYFGGLALGFTLTENAPAGYIYVHPSTGKRFLTVSGFRSWCARHPGEPRVLVLRTR